MTRNKPRKRGPGKPAYVSAATKEAVGAYAERHGLTLRHIFDDAVQKWLHERGVTLVLPSELVED